MGRLFRIVLAGCRRLGLVRPLPSEPPSGQLAFASLAKDPGLLARLPRPQARRLGAQAEEFASVLIREGSSGVPSAAAAGVVRLVRQFSARDAIRGEGVDDMVQSALSGAAGGLGGLLRTIAREGPQVSDSSAELASEAVRVLGPDGIARIGTDDADALIRVAGMHAARVLRAPRRPGPPSAGELEAVAALRVIEAACAQARVLPLVSVACEDRRLWADHLVDLWRDASTCVAHTEAPSCRLWEDARDGHAFGAIWLMPSVLQTLVRVEAEQLARDARSAASFVIRRARGRREALEAARTVMVSCGEGWDSRLAVPELVRPSEVRVRASLA